MNRIHALTLGLASLAAPAALAAPCAGFNDVDSTSGFCPSVEWMKNREITTGCGDGTVYCPDNGVTRLAMAAFMKRLGTALTPVELRGQQSGAVDLDANLVVCQTNAFTAALFPRHAVVDFALSSTAPTALDVEARIVATLDNGATWTALHQVASRMTVPANNWASTAALASVDLARGDVVKFGARVTRAAGTADLSNTWCSLRAQIGNRNGTSSPF